MQHKMLDHSYYCANFFHFVFGWLNQKQKLMIKIPIVVIDIWGAMKIYLYLCNGNRIEFSGSLLDTFQIPFYAFILLVVCSLHSSDDPIFFGCFFISTLIVLQSRLLSEIVVSIWNKNEKKSDDNKGEPSENTLNSRP